MCFLHLSGIEELDGLTLALWSQVLWLFCRQKMCSYYLLNFVIIVSSLLNLINKHSSKAYLEIIVSLLNVSCPLIRL